MEDDFELSFDLKEGEIESMVSISKSTWEVFKSIMVLIGRSSGVASR